MGFVGRHIGNIRNPSSVKKMLRKTGVKSVDRLVKNTNIKQNFKLNKKIKTKIPSLTENGALQELKNIVDKNKFSKSYLGLGYYNTLTPEIIKRHMIENPQWYTAYTPYQAEISQGRLESQYNYQTVVKELTGLPIANGSLLDEASAAGEALNLSYGYFRKKRNKFIVSDTLHPQTLDILETRSKTLSLDMNVIDIKNASNLDNRYDPAELCNIIFQYPDTYGNVHVPFDFIQYAKDNNILTTGITDLLALTKIISPGELGLNITLGNCQRFGIPLWFGGPHPAFFAVSSELLRYVPGRIIGESKDINGDKALRLALQTREQHIKRQSATSNICTSQSLLTNVVSFYTIYHGPKGLTEKSKEVNNKAKYFLEKISPDVKSIISKQFYDTISFKVIYPYILINELKAKDILVRHTFDNNKNNIISITFDESHTYEDIDKMISIIKNYKYSWNDNNLFCQDYNYYNHQLSKDLRRQSSFLESDLFNTIHTETKLLRYMNKLALKDYTLCNGMIPLGSCTMKLNAAYQLQPLLWKKISSIHPFVPREYAQGYMELIQKTGDYLKTLTGFQHISFQPNSGATGEYAGLLCIKKYHEENGDSQRKICLIPKSAHGTNFASAAIANLDVKVFEDSLLDNLSEFNQYLSEFQDKLACLMITYPNTNGVFQRDINLITKAVHENGGLVYMDGANMNALVGIFQPGKVGFDVCHLNIHKTFCIPHGGGGPGLGPILCNNKLQPYLPTNSLQIKNDSLSNTNKSCGMVSASNWSSASLITIPFLYISAMGIDGLTKATKMAILHSNYLKNSLKDSYKIIDVNENDAVGHEFIIDISNFKHLGITENDIAKRLMDYSFHPPTMSWPRTGVLMFEPTESESIDELDRLVEAMKSIRQEIKEIEDGICDKDNNVIKNAPHNFKMTENWNYPYSITKAFYPVKSLYGNKFNVPVGRVDDIYGDRLLMKK